MSDEETAKTEKFLLSSAGMHAIVVIEHDMVFVRQSSARQKGTVLRQGDVLCEDPVARSKRTRKGKKFLSEGNTRVDHAKPSTAEPIVA